MNHEFEDIPEEEFAARARFITGRQVFRRKPKSINYVINNLMAKKGYNQNQSISDLQTAWDSVLDGSLKNRTRVLGIKRGRLEIVVDSSAVNQELVFQKKSLIKKFRNLPIGKSVTELRIRIGEIK